MKIVLLEDVPKLGRKYEIKEVANGYARNFLIRFKKALKAIPGTEEYYKNKREKHLDIIRASKDEIKTKLNTLKESLVFKSKANEEGTLFGSIDSQEISTLLSEKLSFNIEPDWIALEENIKTIGEYEIDIINPHDKEKESLGKIKIEVLLEE